LVTAQTQSEAVDPLPDPPDDEDETKDEEKGWTQ
jgi:hypothetical protein